MRANHNGCNLMEFGLDVPTTAAYADPLVLAQMAKEAEETGWDGFFVWDVLFGSNELEVPVIDPWIALTAIVLNTSRIKIGLMVGPLARHRPWLVARRLANLDQLSRGRTICTVGIGYLEREFAAFGEDDNPSARAGKLEEALEIMAGLWSHERFSYSGKYYSLNNVTLSPKPVQSPRIPLWVAGGWPHRAPFRRAARWDGACIKSRNQDTRRPLSLADFRACVEYVQVHRTGQGPFAIVASGETPASRRKGTEVVLPFQKAGASWWVEEGLGWSLEEFRTRIRAGPPESVVE